MFALSLLFYLLLFGLIAAGFQFITGRAHPDGGIIYKTLGAIMVCVGIALFGATVKQWSEYFFAFCSLMAIKALFAFVTGYTISQPRLAVGRAQAAEYFGLLVAMVFLSYRYADRPPRTALESISLVCAIVGLALGVAFDSRIWPVAGGVVLLAMPLFQNHKVRAIIVNRQL